MQRPIVESDSPGPYDRPFATSQEQRDEAMAPAQLAPAAYPLDPVLMTPAPLARSFARASVQLAVATDLLLRRLLTLRMANADTLALKQVDAFNTEFALKKAGKVVITGTRTISRDGKVMTITNKGTNAKGQAVNDVQVFEKR